MEITGRVTGDAQIKTTKDHRELVAFTVAVNESYKPKGGEKVDVTAFFNCAYWLSTNVAKALKKSSIVTLFGHAGINAYKGQMENTMPILRSMLTISGLLQPQKMAR